MLNNWLSVCQLSVILNRALDIVNVMAYDLHGAWITDKAGHHAPLFKGPFGVESTQSVVSFFRLFDDLT